VGWQRLRLIRPELLIGVLGCIFVVERLSQELRRGAAGAVAPLSLGIFKNKVAFGAAKSLETKISSS